MAITVTVLEGGGVPGLEDVGLVLLLQGWRSLATCGAK
jgi:hypothetical protein